MAQITIREFTDPACPWAFSAEPSRWRLSWLYGDQLRWQPRMVVLAESRETYEERGFTPERNSAGLRTLQERFGMPIDWRPRPVAATVDACRAVVAVRLHASPRDTALLRRLRVRGMAGEAIDDPAVIAGAAQDAGIDTAELAAWLEDPAVEEALRADMAAARSPSAAALALDHKLADWPGGRRYTCPSYELESSDGSRLDAPGYQPAAVYEAMVANLAPDLERRSAPDSVAEVLAWAKEPLATAEVAEVCGLDRAETRQDLAAVADERPVGPDGYWSLR